MLSPFKESPPAEKIRVSVSQIRKYVRCQRAWWYEYGPLKIRPPTKKSAAVGTEVHGILEDYLINGTPPPDTKAGRIASAGLDKLRPGEELEIERSITLPLNDAANMLCRIDMLGKNEPYVGDHKTTGNFSWCKTRSEVVSDVQLLSYAFAGYHETKPPTVEVELIYYRREGLPVSMSVGGVVAWEDVEKNWHDLGEIAREMQPRKTDTTGDTCAGNSSACGDYGGCFHAPKCPFSPRNLAKLKKEFAQVKTNEYKRSEPQQGANKMDFYSSFGIAPPEQPGPTVHTPEPAFAPDPELMNKAYAHNENEIDRLNQAPPAPSVTVKKRRCDNAALVVYAGILAAEFPDGCTAEKFEERSKEILAPNKVTDSRRQRLLKYSGVRIVSAFPSPFDPGYTEEPDAFEAVEEPPADIAAPSPSMIRGLEAHEAVEELLHSPSAITAPCVLLVGVQVNTQIATSIDEWLKPHIAAALALPDNYDAQKGRNRTWFEAQIAYKNGEQLLGHVLADVMEDGPPAGLFYLSPRHPVAGVVLAAFEAAGATIAIGQI